MTDEDRLALYLPTSPYISLHLHTSSYISLYLPSQARLALADEAVLRAVRVVISVSGHQVGRYREI